MAGFLKKAQIGAKLKGSLTATKESFHAAKNKADVLIAAAAVDLHENIESTMERFEVNYDKYLDKPVTLTAKVWKRRGGIARYKHRQGGNAWELRRMELRGTALLYYNALDEEEIIFGGSSRDLRASEANLSTPPKSKLTASAVWSPDSKESPMNASTTSMDESSRDVKLPRGLLDLAEEKATVHASMGHQTGAPSPFCLSIMTGLVKQETKWKLAFDDQASLMLWLAALTDIVVQTSLDDYNVQLLKAANPNNPDPPPIFLRPPPVFEPPTDGDPETKETLKASGSTQHSFWFTGDYSISSKDKQIQSNDQSDNKTPSTPEKDQASSGNPPSIASEKLPSMLDHTRALQDLEKQHQQERQQREDKHQRELQAARAKIEELTQTNNAKAEANAATQAQLRDQNVLQAKKAIELEKTKTDLAELQERMDIKVEKLQEQIQSMKAKHQRDLTEQGANQKSPNKGADNQSQQRKLDEKEQEINNLTSQLEELENAHNQKVKQLQENLSTTEQSKVMAIKLVEDQWQKKLDKEKQQAQRRLEAALEEAAAKDNGAEDESSKGLAEKEEQIATLSSELESMRAATTEQIKSLQDQLSQATAKHESTQGESQKVIAELQQKLQLQTEKIANLEKSVPSKLDDSHNDFEECDEFEDAIGE
ncbi:DUF1336 domain containing protein, expressed [Seminavis robusta]|uniref:DUF1336 domain containing protein, expressed n=1 Tax=Seminavis robusta TaxID=568900 RepID=A0A9N8HG75_9STRA|nr:DUF1336 domain containing protein, expressed [Seminavis robusta]|eukprot:Sro494_g154280.1 DUF1336 domain containing protein, expressed (653) ;mRNA; f:37338-39296